MISKRDTGVARNLDTAAAVDETREEQHDPPAAAARTPLNTPTGDTPFPTFTLPHVGLTLTPAAAAPSLPPPAPPPSHAVAAAAAAGLLLPHDDGDSSTPRGRCSAMSLRPPSPAAAAVGSAAVVAADRRGVKRRPCASAEASYKASSALHVDCSSSRKALLFAAALDIPLHAEGAALTVTAPAAAAAVVAATPESSAAAAAAASTRMPSGASFTFPAGQV